MNEKQTLILQRFHRRLLQKLIIMGSKSQKVVGREKAIISGNVFSSKCMMLTSWPEDRLKLQKLPKVHRRGRDLALIRLKGLQRGPLKIKETVWQVLISSLIQQRFHSYSIALTETKQLTTLAGQRPANTIPCQCTMLDYLSWKSAPRFNQFRYSRDSGSLIL